MMKFSNTFWSPYEQYRDRIGQAFTVTGKVDDNDKDPEVGDMYKIKFADGKEIVAWPEEVEVAAIADVKRQLNRKEL